MHTYGIIVGEDETQAVCLVEVERVCVKDPYVNLPFSEVVCFDEIDAWRETMFGLVSSNRCQLVRVRRKRQRAS